MEANKKQPDPSEAVDPLAKERDVKFKRWLQNKAVKDKAFEYLSKLDSSRASSDDKLLEVGVALCAVDRILGGDEESKQKEEKEGEKKESASSKRTLKAAWMKWAMEFHSFSMLTLTDTDLASLSDAVKEFLFSEYELAISSGLSQEEKDRADRRKNILPSLKYFFPTVPKPGEKPKPLTPDQKYQNVMFMRELKKFWKKCERETEDRVLESVARGLREREGGRESEEKERKSKMSAVNESAGPSRPSPAASAALARALEMQCLNDLSLRRLREWVEEDEDEKREKEQESLADKIREAKKSHEQFVRKKDSLRIRLPETVPAVPVVPMSYGRETAAIRPQGRGVSSTVELMAGSGMKYVHATNKGRKGVEGDLEKSRKQLLKLGFVARDNFDPEDRSLFEREKVRNEALREKEAAEAQLREESARAYEDWLAQKDLREQALQCLRLIDKPQIVIEDTGKGAFFAPERGGVRESSTSHKTLTQGTQSGNKALTTMSSGVNGSNNEYAKFVLQRIDLQLRAHREVVERVVSVGRALKSVDRTLLGEWTQWCDGVLPVHACATLWDFFAPTACDVHSQAFSQVRDSFLKLLRPGLDFREIFMSFAEKHVFAKKLRSCNVEDPDELEELRKQWLTEAGLNKTQLSSLLQSMGVTLRETEMRALVDAFDSNGDGSVSLSEFLSFCGPTRTHRGGQGVRMRERCVWRTTCPLTGMPNAFSLSLPTQRFLRQEKERERGGESDAKRDSEMDSKREGEKMGKTIIRKMANGEKRMYVELVERVRREDLLKRLDLLPADSEVERKSKARDESKRDSREDEYEDDYEYDTDHALNKTAKDKADKAPTHKQCAFAQWTLAQRREGLRTLRTLSQARREEEALRAKVSNGVPPGPPQLWSEVESRDFSIDKKTFIVHQSSDATTRPVNRRSIGDSTDRYVNSQNVRTVVKEIDRERDGESLRESERDRDVPRACTELVLCWCAANEKDLVSFFSVECAGAVTDKNKLGDVKYEELFRDPEDAQSDRFTFSIAVRDLRPGTTYRFRIRAFNGYGPSDYTYKTFTTMAAAPLRPRALRIAPDSVTLRWTFTEEFFARLNELKQIFRLADKDRSGAVQREELTAALDNQLAEFAPLKTFLGKIASSLGVSLSPSAGYGALFDAIETDDDNVISLAEFETFFIAHGWTAAPLSSANVSASVTSAVSSTGSAKLANKGDVVYVVERCESELDSVYKEVLRTTAGQASISHLLPGKSYRFRVMALNVDGIPGPPSLPVTVHTLLETPLPPVVRSISHRSITLLWKKRESSSNNTRNAAFVEKLLGEWTHAQGGDKASEGVSIELAFAHYDRDRSGFIDAEELSLLLQDLGVAVSEERLAQAFSVLDSDGSGSISFAEFAMWWRGESVTYTLRRSEAIPPLPFAQQGRSVDNNTLSAKSIAPNTSAKAISSNATSNRPRSANRAGYTSRQQEEATSSAAVPQTARSLSRARNSTQAPSLAQPTHTAQSALSQQACPVVCLRDERTHYVVEGLSPNSLYLFRLRYCGARASSALSTPVVTMTAPRRPPRPVLAYVSSNTVRVKYYPPRWGCYKFIVQLRIAPLEVVETYAARTTAKGREEEKESDHEEADSEDEEVGSHTTQRTRTITAAASDEGWQNVYTGPDTLYTGTTLVPQTVYELRVRACNYLGTPSQPSQSLVFLTQPRHTTTGSQTAGTGTLTGNTQRGLTAQRVSELFTVECTGDVCVGDTVLVTERLFLREKERTPSSVVSNQPQKVTTNTSATRTSRHSLTQGVRDSDAVSVVSVTHSLNAQTQTAQQHLFVGERTFAAVVVRDNFRATQRSATTTNTSAVSSGVSVSGERALRESVVREREPRRLWLEVVWQRASTERVRTHYALTLGEVVERQESNIEEFEVFRCQWEEEPRRWSLARERDALRECFREYDTTL